MDRVQTMDGLSDVKCGQRAICHVSNQRIFALLARLITDVLVSCDPTALLTIQALQALVALLTRLTPRLS